MQSGYKTNISGVCLLSIGWIQVELVDAQQFLTKDGEKSKRKCNVRRIDGPINDITDQWLPDQFTTIYNPFCYWYSKANYDIANIRIYKVWIVVSHPNQR